MSDLRILAELAGEAALLMWGLHMVQSGLMRAYGARLRRFLGETLGDWRRALPAGVAVTALLQPSTAAALVIASFARAGAMPLVPALTAMLGANMGTALIEQLLAFETFALALPLILIRVIAFRSGQRTRAHDLGRVAIGIGLMLLALCLLSETLAPIREAAAWRALLAILVDHPLIALLLATVLTE